MTGRALYQAFVTGVAHSEFNASKTEPVHFLQIWIVPEQTGIAPGYEQKSFGAAHKPGQLLLVASRGGRQGSLTMHRDVDMYVTRLAAGERVTHDLGEGRAAWVQVARGSLLLNGQALAVGDGAAVPSAGRLSMTGSGDAEVLLFDIPATDVA